MSKDGVPVCCAFKTFWRFMNTIMDVCFYTICRVYFNLLMAGSYSQGLSVPWNWFAQLFWSAHPSLMKALLHNAVPVTKLGLLQSRCLMTHWKHLHFLLSETVAASNRKWGSRQLSLTVKPTASWRGTMA